MENKIKCSKCGEEKLESDFYLRKENGERRKDCNKCCIKRTANQANLKKPKFEHDYEKIYQQYKKCSRCKAVKLGKFFYRVKAN